MRSHKAIAFLVLVAAPSFAEDRMLQVCTAGGYFSGAEDKFLSRLATHILVKKGIFGTAACSAAWKDAYEVGISASETGKVANNSEAEIVKHAAQFSDRVYSAVLKNMEP